MNTKAIPLFLTLWFLSLTPAVWAQDAYQFGGLPSLNLNSKLKNDWSLNTKIESRQLFQRREFNSLVDKHYTYLLTDFSLILAKDVGLNSRVAGGYLIRFEDGELFHRFIQQYVMVQKLSGFRLAHRFLSDQTFSKSENPEIRLRYRITGELPLNGASVDPDEFYIKINNEYVNSLQAGAYDLEVRLIPILGYGITHDFKIEAGLDYRIDAFLSHKTRHSYWMTVNFFIDL